MGDYPIKNARSPIELTDQIFGPATQHQALQDEIYCQIMRQMTSNNNRCSLTVFICMLKHSHIIKSQHILQQSSVNFLFFFTLGWVWSVGGSSCGCVQACFPPVRIWWDTLSASWSRGPETSWLLAACRGCTGCTGQTGIRKRYWQHLHLYMQSKQLTNVSSSLQSKKLL